jgi:K+-sensing histidine kinase KdpD
MMKTLHTTVSHDMMTPLINIKFFASQMLKAGLERNIKELEKYHKMVIDSGQII